MDRWTDGPMDRWTDGQNLSSLPGLPLLARDFARNAQAWDSQRIFNTLALCTLGSMTLCLPQACRCPSAMTEDGVTETYRAFFLWQLFEAMVYDNYSKQSLPWQNFSAEVLNFGQSLVGRSDPQLDRLASTNWHAPMIAAGNATTFKNGTLAHRATPAPTPSAAARCSASHSRVSVIGRCLASIG